MQRKLKALLTAGAVAGLVMVGPQASAHHVTVTGQVVCNTQTGDFDITWKIANSEDDKVMSYESRLGNGTVSASGSVTKTESVTDEGEVSLYVKASWPNGVKDDAKGKVWAQGDCEPPPPPPPPTTKKKHVKVKVAVRDECNCWRDSVRLIADRDKVKVKTAHPNSTTWKFRVTGRKVQGREGPFIQYLLPNKMRGNSGWEVRQWYTVKTTNKVCPCHKNNTCDPLKHDHDTCPQGANRRGGC